MVKEETSRRIPAVGGNNYTHLSMAKAGVIHISFLGNKTEATAAQI